MSSFETEVVRTQSQTDMLRVKDAVKRLEEITRRIAEIEDELASAKKVQAQISEVELPDIFDILGLQEIKLDDGRKVSLKDDVTSSIAEANREAAFAWLRENEFDSIIKREVKLTFGMGEDAKAAALCEELIIKGLPVAQKEFVHPGTLKAFVQERIRAGLQLPESITVFPFRKTIIK